MTINPVMEIGSREAVWMAVERNIGVVSDIKFISHPRNGALELAVPISAWSRCPKDFAATHQLRMNCFDLPLS